MNNVEYKITGDKLVVTIDISKTAIDNAPPSASGKTCLVASTAGSMSLPTVNGCTSLSLALNLMCKK